MSGKATGLGVDATGAPVIDPTANVIALVQANKESADALNTMRDRYVDAEIRVVRETVKWIEKLADVHQRHDATVHQMEQDKLAAFRANDEMARLTEAARTQAAVDLVARAAETTANDIRAVLRDTASALAERDAARDRENNNRMAALEKARYEDAGKQAVADPMLIEMREDQKKLIVALTNMGGKTEGAKSLWFIIAAVIAVLGFLTTEGIVLAGVVLYVSKR